MSWSLLCVPDPYRCRYAHSGSNDTMLRVDLRSTETKRLGRDVPEPLATPTSEQGATPPRARQRSLPVTQPRGKAGPRSGVRVHALPQDLNARRRRAAAHSLIHSAARRLQSLTSGRTQATGSLTSEALTAVETSSPRAYLSSLRSSLDGLSDTFASVRTYSSQARVPRPAIVACIACTSQCAPSRPPLNGP